jgi:hypothetical protein
MQNVHSRLSLRKREIRSAASLLALVLYLFVLVLASSHELHHFFHQDENGAQHQCAATILAGGQVDAAPAVAALPIPAVTLNAIRPVDFLPAASCRSWLPPGRGPPVSPA